MFYGSPVIFRHADKTENSIVAVHGLGNSDNTTWAHVRNDGQQLMWLKDLIPTHLRSTARVMTFSHNLATESGISLNDIKAVATTLLDRLNEQPKVFIRSTIKTIGDTELTEMVLVIPHNLRRASTWWYSHQTGVHY
jgi:hypothetical protein